MVCVRCYIIKSAWSRKKIVESNSEFFVDSIGRACIRVGMVVSKWIMLDWDRAN